MAILDSQALQPDFIKLRWLEPYVSAGLNRRHFKNTPRGIYSGFVVRPGPADFEVTVKHDDPEGFGEVSGFSQGAFDPASSGWSIAVHASLEGFTTTVAILAQAGGAADFTFDLSAQKGKTVFVALDVQYKTGFGSTGQVKIVEAADLDSDPTLINLARVDVPLTGSIVQANIINDDGVYPRVLPFANKLKYGFMSKFQAELLEDIVNISGTPALVSEVIIPVDGPQTISLPPGFRYTVGGDDLWVHKNGNHKTRGASRDYLEVDRGDGYGEEIDYLGPLKAGDYVKFRVQAFSSVLTSRTKVFDENALISDNVIRFNFTGTGVTVFPDGPNGARVVIPGGGGANQISTKLNLTGSEIPIYRAVSLQADNSIKLFDTSVSSEVFYGITTQAIPDSVSGDVQTGGKVVMAALGVSGDVGNDVWIDHGGLGIFTADPPDPLSGQVIRVGILDADFGTSPEDILFDRGRLA